MQQLAIVAEAVFGVGQANPSLSQRVARGVLVYLAALVMMRWGEKRNMGKNTAFDVILGSLVSRAVNSAANIAPTLAAGVVLVCMHRALHPWRSAPTASAPS